MFEWIVSASILIVIVIISRYLLKGRVRCWVQYSLWLLVALRLLIPISPVESVFSVANLLPENRMGQESGTDPVQRISETGLGGQNTASLPEEILGESNSNVAVPETTAGLPSQHFQAETVDNPSTDSIAGGKTNTTIPILTILWLAGAVLLALWLTAVNGSFRRKVRRNRQTLEISGLLPVYVTDQVQTPCMYGLLHPAVYVTPQVAEEPEILAMVLRHEQMHYHHGDHFWAVVRMLCLCIHWYNPLVWAAVRLSRQDGELACDEGVLRQLGEEGRKSYGEALLALSMEQKPSRSTSMNLATSMSGTKKQLKERLTALVKTPHMAAGAAVFVVILSLGLAACTFTGRQQGEPEGSEGTESGIDLQQSVDTEPEDEESPESASAENGTQQTERDPGDWWAPWIFAEEYTGYLDECPGGGWQDIYANQDYDGDGLTDRIYQDVESEPGVMKMRVEFGNGEILEFDTYMNSPLVVQSMDLDGDGSLELLFTKPNEFSTNPAAIATDILLFTREEDGYRQVEIPLEDVAEEYLATPLEADLILSYEKADDTHIRMSWHVPGAKGELGKTQEVLREADEYAMEYYRNYLGQSYPQPAYDAELIQGQYAFLRLCFEGMGRSGDDIFVDLTLGDELSPISSGYINWTVEEGNPVAEVTEGGITRRLIYVETSWSLGATEVLSSNTHLYWICQALQELEQWTGTALTEVCCSVSPYGEYYFAQSPEDMQHSRVYYSRCYGSLAGGGNSIQSVYYITDMDAWFSPVKQYTMPAGYDSMSTEKILTWFFERSVIAQGSKVTEITMPLEGDYVLHTDQDTYYEYYVEDKVQKGLSLSGPYDSYPEH